MAEVPSVAVDIAPVHSLVARVMEGVGEPNLIIPASASPHEYSLRPSEAKSLQNADMVFWEDQELTPWLEKSIDTLSQDAQVEVLQNLSETKLLKFREGALFEAHDDDDHLGHKDHDDHDNQDHDKAHNKHAGHDRHNNGSHDPHVWLPIENAQTWLNLFACKLSAADPQNATIYFGNAVSAIAEIYSFSEEVDAILDLVRGQLIIVLHDA